MKTEIKLTDIPFYVRFAGQVQPLASGQIVNRTVSECGEYLRVQDQVAQTVRYYNFMNY